MMFVVLVDLKASRVSKVHWNDFNFSYSSVSEYKYLLRWSVKQFNLKKISKWFWLTLVILIREISVFVMVSPTAQICVVNFRLMGTSGWQNVKKAAYKVTEPEDISVSSQQEEKYSFFSKYSRVQFLPYANFEVYMVFFPLLQFFIFGIGIFYYLRFKAHPLIPHK